MKEDKDLLKELLHTKFKDDVIESSRNNFDNIFDAVQEKSDDKSLFYWYTAAVIVLMLIGVFTLYYLKNNKTPNTNREETSKETPIQKENINLVAKPIDTTSSTNEESNIITDRNEISEDINQLENPITKQIDVTTLEPEDEIIEKGVITVTYTASDKYASTEHTKYNRLPDSSTIVVRKNSKVNFTATTQGYRRADITGTVFFNIRKEESIPFILFGKHSKIQITGNSFAIHSDSKADLMTLTQGSAKVVHNTTKEIRDLIPGESLRVDQNGIFSLEKSPNRFAWKTGSLQYQNANVRQVINDLGENYDAKILLKNADILNCKFSGSFEKSNTTKVLAKLASALKLRITKKDDLFTITGQGCNK